MYGCIEKPDNTTTKDDRIKLLPLTAVYFVIEVHCTLNTVCKHNNVRYCTSCVPILLVISSFILPCQLLN